MRKQGITIIINRIKAEKYDNEEYKIKEINNLYAYFKEPKKRVGSLIRRLDKGSITKS
jgi:hypothetical protein